MSSYCLMCAQWYFGEHLEECKRCRSAIFRWIPNADLRLFRSRCALGALALLLLLLPSPAAAAPRVSCTAINVGLVVTHMVDKKQVVEEKENWSARCTIKDGDELIDERGLVLPFPATFDEAIAAIDEYRKHFAPRLLKERHK